MEEELTIAARFKEYMQMLYPEGYSNRQYEEAKSAFYGGGIAVYDLIVHEFFRNNKAAVLPALTEEINGYMAALRSQDPVPIFTNES